jgi:hypothetical protein
VKGAAHDAPQSDEIFQHPIIHVGEDQLAISTVHRYLEETVVHSEEVADEEGREVLGDMDPDVMGEGRHGGGEGWVEFRLPGQGPVYELGKTKSSLPSRDRLLATVGKAVNY